MTLTNCARISAFWMLMYALELAIPSAPHPIAGSFLAGLAVMFWLLAGP